MSKRKNQEENEDQKLPINRGVELMLRRKKENPPEQTGILFKKTIQIFRRKINLTIEISKEV
jgi:hypothetical protein